MHSSVDVAIIGAGAAGVAAGRRLQLIRPDLSLQVLEAASRIGGRAQTAMVEGLPLDLGCGWLHGARDNAWTSIAAELGLTLDNALASWDGAGRDMGLDPADDEAAEHALTAFFERAERLARGTDQPLSAALEAGCRWNGLIGAIGTYINGVALEHASLLDFDRYDPGRGPDRRVREGYGHTVATYGDPLPIAFAATVNLVDHSGAQLRIESTIGTLEAKAVIVAVPTTPLARGQLRFQPPLPDKTAAAAALPLGLANKLFLAIPDDVELPPETHRIGSPFHLATAAYHIRPFGRPVIECYFGGDCARRLDGDAKAATAFAVDELAEPLGRATASRLRPLAMSGWANQPLIGGSYSYALPGAVPMRAVLARPVDERLFFAGEACSPNRYSTAHGAFETGVAAAEAVAAALPKA